MRLELNFTLYEANAQIDYVYFPTSAIASALTVMADGSAIEVGTTGREGAVGVYAAIDEAITPHKTVIQIEGDALRIAARHIQALADSDPQLRKLLLRYYTAFHAQVSRSVACNGLHPLSKRCCRWLLMTHDRVDGDQFYLSHEFLAMMLGVRRAGVTEALQELKESGLIDYARGNIKIVDRKGLEAACCECYQFAESEYERILRIGE